MTNKTRLTRLENATRTHATEWNWKRFIQCDNPAELPEEYRKEWTERMENQTRAMDTLAGALTDILGQPITPEETQASIRNLCHDY